MARLEAFSAQVPLITGEGSERLLVERRGGTGSASGMGDTAKAGHGNNWSSIQTTQEPMPDEPLAEGED